MPAGLAVVRFSDVTTGPEMGIVEHIASAQNGTGGNPATLQLSRQIKAVIMTVQVSMQRSSSIEKRRPVWYFFAVEPLGHLEVQSFGRRLCAFPYSDGQLRSISDLAEVAA